MNQNAKDKKRTGVLLLGHGSRLFSANEPLKDVARTINDSGLYDSVEAAFLQLTEPDFTQTVDLLASKEMEKIIIMPYFLYTGIHVRDDLPNEMRVAQGKYPDIEFVMAPNLGYHPSLVDITMERLGETSASEPTAPTTAPSAIHPIEAESFRIIGSEIDESSFPPERLPIIKRVIHATADFNYAEILKFSPGAIDAGLRALEQGKDIITDVTMVKAGISTARLKAFNNGSTAIHCFIADKGVAQLSKRENITRSTASMRHGASFMDGAIVVIGNAPTALRELISLIKAHKASPALVIGVPVGFVDAQESKTALMDTQVEFISTAGRKGGSTVAVSIINALIILAAQKAHTAHTLRETNLVAVSGD